MELLQIAASLQENSCVIHTNLLIQANMRNFTRNLHHFLLSHEMTQTDFSARSGIYYTRLSRLLSEDLVANPTDLDRVLKVVQGPERYDFVLAFIRDKCSEDALLECEIFPTTTMIVRDVGIDVRHLSARGEKALSYLCALRHRIPSIEDIFIDLARALGWDEQL